MDCPAARQSDRSTLSSRCPLCLGGESAGSGRIIGELRKLRLTLPPGVKLCLLASQRNSRRSRPGRRKGWPGTWTLGTMWTEWTGGLGTGLRTPAMGGGFRRARARAPVGHLGFARGCGCFAAACRGPSGRGAGRGSFGRRKRRGRQRPPIALNGLPPPLERRKEYYEKACLCRIAVCLSPLTKQSIRCIPQRAKCSRRKSPMRSPASWLAGLGTIYYDCVGGKGTGADSSEGE